VKLEFDSEKEAALWMQALNLMNIKD